MGGLVKTPLGSKTAVDGESSCPCQKCVGRAGDEEFGDRGQMQRLGFGVENICPETAERSELF